MPRYDFECRNESCNDKGKIITLDFHMTDEKEGKCQTCGESLHRRWMGMSFYDEYKGEGFSRSADAREEEDVWK